MVPGLSERDLWLIRHKWECEINGAVVISNNDVRRLLAEVERLRALNAPPAEQVARTPRKSVV